jgi:hypothetical protein
VFLLVDVFLAGRNAIHSWIKLAVSGVMMATRQLKTAGSEAAKESML